MPKLAGWPCQDSAASTVVVGTPANGVLTFAGNTSASSNAAMAGAYARALTLDGVNDHVACSSIAANGQNATMVICAKLNGAQNAYDGIMYCRGAGENSFGLAISKNGGLELTFVWKALIYTFDWESDLHAPDNEFCMIAVAVEPTQATLYVFRLDGTVQGITNVNPFPAQDFAQSPKIGGDVTFSRMISGSLCGAEIWDETLSQTALQAIWDQRLETLTAATVVADGSSVNLTFAVDPGAITPALLTVRQSGVQMPVSAVTGSGTSRNAELGIRWVMGGRTVEVSHGVNTVTATNDSIITERAVRYIARGLGMSVCYGINTYLSTDFSDGTQSGHLFAPTEPIADCIDQWIAVAKSAGATFMWLTCKHVEGFCLWPTATTPYNISASNWYGPAGSPNIVKLYAQKLRAAGLGVGLYTCFWDQNFKVRNPAWNNAQYAAHNEAQVLELITQFGPLDYFFIDGWGWLGDTELTPSFTDIPYQPIRDLFDQYQPNCCLAVNSHEHEASAGPNSLAHSDVAVWEAAPPAGDGFIVAGNKWPAENSVTIRGDHFWYWHDLPDTPKSAATLAGYLNESIERRGTFIVNVPPDRSGMITDRYAKVMADIGSVRPETYLRTTLPGYSIGRLVNQ